MLLTEHLERLTSFEPGPFPVISLCLDTRVNSPERESVDADVAKIREYGETVLETAACASLPAGAVERSIPTLCRPCNKLEQRAAVRRRDVDGLTVGSSLQILDVSLRVLREEDAKTDREKVGAMIGAWRDSKSERSRFYSCRRFGAYLQL